MSVLGSFNFHIKVQYYFLLFTFIENLSFRSEPECTLVYIVSTYLDCIILLKHFLFFKSFNIDKESCSCVPIYLEMVPMTSMYYLQRKNPFIAKSYISFFVFIRWYINSSELLYQSPNGNIPLRLLLIACKTCKWLGPNLLLIQCITTESYKSRNKEGSYSAVSGYALITLHPFPECMSLSLQCFIGSDIFITNCK